MIKVNDKLAVKIEKRAMLVESEFPGTFYAIDREGKGMWILTNGVEIPICGKQVESFANEIKEVWETLKNGGE